MKSGDFRYALRGFRRNPGFAAIAIATLAVGIGANTSIFSVMDAVLLRQLPYLEPEKLAFISAVRDAGGPSQGPLSWVRYRTIRDQNRSFSNIAAFTYDTFNLTGRGEPEQLQAARVTYNFFDVLGVRPAAGRWFSPDEDKQGGSNAVVLTYSFWTRRFGNAKSAIGQWLTLDSKDYLIAGVLPASFNFTYFGPIDIVTTRVYEISGMSPPVIEGGAMFLSAVARLAPQSSFRGAEAEMETLAAQYRAERPRFPDADPRMKVHVDPLRDSIVANVKTALLILFGAVGLVLMIACANVANLSLSRALGRTREFAVRAAIGATRAQVIRQLLIECTLLAVAAGVLGTALSWGGTKFLTSLARNNLPRVEEIHMSATVLAFTLVVSLLAGILFGLAPALHVSRADLNSALRAEGRGSTANRRRNMLRNLLVVGQVALSVILTIGAGLLLRNFIQLRDSGQGFDAHNLMTANISFPQARYNKVAIINFSNQLLSQVRALPGVQSAAIASALPLNATRYTPALPEGQPVVPAGERPVFNLQMLSVGYAAAMRLPVVRGREFNESDNADSRPVMLVNQTVAKRFWPNQDPVGKHVTISTAAPPFEVVGVIGDVRNNTIATDVRAELYLPLLQRVFLQLNLIVRTQGDPHAVVNPIRACVQSLDRDLPLTGIQTMDEVLAAGAAQPRFTTTLLATLSGAALILAIIGIYGVISYSVGERTNEIGVRIALGADRQAILRLVLGQALTLSGIGIATGILVSLGLTRLMTSMLYHVSTTDPVIFGAGALLFVTVAIVAGYLPARRAMRVDPTIALR